MASVSWFVDSSCQHPPLSSRGVLHYISGSWYDHFFGHTTEACGILGAWVLIMRPPGNSQYDIFIKIPVIEFRAQSNPVWSQFNLTHYICKDHISKWGLFWGSNGYEYAGGIIQPRKLINNKNIFLESPIFWKSTMSKHVYCVPRPNTRSPNYPFKNRLFFSPFHCFLNNWNSISALSHFCSGGSEAHYCCCSLRHFFFKLFFWKTKDNL